ncbi:hypothetical protein pb186bvf_017972 [Paramecium bursaria]
MNQNENISKHICYDRILICTINDCKNKRRFICQQCSNTHQHDKLDQKHIIEISKFFSFISEKIEPVTQTMKQLKQTLELINHNDRLVTDELIEKLLNITNIEQSELDQIYDYLNSIKQESNPTLLIKNLNSEEQKIIKENKMEEQKVQYDSHYYFKSKNWLLWSSICNSEQYLAYTDKKESITIINIKMKKKVKIFYLQDNIIKQQFNNNSNLLFYGDYKGNLCCYNIKHFKQLRKFDTKTWFFTDLKAIQDRIIISSRSDNCIIIYDIASNSIIQKVEDTLYNNYIDYDYNNQILVGSQENFVLKFYNNKNEILIEHKDPDKFVSAIQIQLVNQCKNLLTRSNNLINLWQIMYDRKCLIQLKEYQINYQLYNFQSLRGDTRIVSITKDKLQILNSDFNQIYETNHNITDYQKLYFNQSIKNSTVQFHQLYINNGLILNPDLQKIVNIKQYNYKTNLIDIEYIISSFMFNSQQYNNQNVNCIICSILYHFLFRVFFYTLFYKIDVSIYFDNTLKKIILQLLYEKKKLKHQLASLQLLLICNVNNCKNEKRFLCILCQNTRQYKQIDQQHIMKFQLFRITSLIKQRYNIMNQQNIFILLIILCYMLKYIRILNSIINNINLVMQKNAELSSYFELYFDNFKKNIFMTQISPNQQLLLYTDSQNLLSIKKFRTNLKKKYILVCIIAVRCQFNSLSNIVYCGDLQGHITSFNKIIQIQLLNKQEEMQRILIGLVIFY